MKNLITPAIIGAGISGLSVAYRLTRLGINPTIFEPGEIGGVVQTSHLNGFTLEHGPNVLLLKEALSKLISELNLSEEMVSPITAKYKQCVWYNGKSEIVPKTPLALFTTNLIPTAAKLKLPLNLTRKNLLDGAEDLSIFDLFSKVLGPQGVSRLLDPALRGIVGGDLKTLSARSMFEPVWSHLEKGSSLLSFIKSRKASPKKKIFIFKQGMESLSKALLNAIAEKTRIVKAKVVGIELQEKGFAVTTANTETRNYSHLFVTTAGSETASFMQNLAPQLIEPLNSVKFANIVVVHAALTKPTNIPKDTFGVLFPSSAPTKLMGVMYNSMLFPHLAPLGKELITICLGGAADNNVLALSDIEIKKIVEKDLKDLLGIDSVEILALNRWSKAIPQYALGHFKMVQELRECENKNPGLYFCGADIGGVGVPDRVEAAEQAILRFSC